MDLVRPTTVVSETSSSLSHVEAFSSGEGLSVVKSLNRSENVDITLHELGELDQVFASLETGAVKTPGRVECLVGGLNSEVDILSQSFGDGNKGLASGWVDDAAVSLLS